MKTIGEKIKRIFSPKGLPISWAGASHIGKIRQRNEDCYAVDGELGLWVVCDGVGGGADGDKASRLAVSVVVESYRAGKSLSEAILQADVRLREMAVDTSMGKNRPGCTVVALAIQDLSWQMAWVGDSRGWLLEKDVIRQVSIDHTITRQLVSWGDITEEEAKTHPDRHRLTQALGLGDRPPKVAEEKGLCTKNTTFLLATDGLAFWDEPDRLAVLLREKASERKLVDLLIAASLEAGGHDNVTCIVVAM